MRSHDRARRACAATRARRGGARGARRPARGQRDRACTTTAPARSRRRGGEVAYANDALAGATTDALQLFLNQIGRYPLLTAPGGGRDRATDRARRPRGEEPDDQLEPPPRGLDRQELPGPRPVAARPDPGGDHRPDPRRREVRLAQGLQVLDLRDVVDQAGRAARRRQQGAHDPHPGARRRARAEADPRRARLPTEHSRPASDEELAGRTMLPVKHVHDVHDAARAVTSLDKPIGEATPARSGSSSPPRRHARRGGRGPPDQGRSPSRPGDAAGPATA